MGWRIKKPPKQRTGHYEQQIWPIRLICFFCETVLGAAPRRDDLYHSTLMWCDNCEDFMKVEMQGEGKSKPISGIGGPDGKSIWEE